MDNMIILNKILELATSETPISITTEMVKFGENTYVNRILTYKGFCYSFGYLNEEELLNLLIKLKEVEAQPIIQQPTQGIPPYYEHHK